MKKLFLFIILVSFLWFAALANATLINNGGGLIYDTDLNITWYDYTNTRGSWNKQMDWAASLSVTDVYGNSYTGWRLPSTLDGIYVLGTDGTTTAGYNITTSEMGHLYYSELHKVVYKLDLVPW